jgi:hypothetical protein
MTIGSMLVTVVLAAIGVAAFATSPLILAVTIAVALVTLAVVAERLGRSLGTVTPVSVDDLVGTGEIAVIDQPEVAVAAQSLAPSEVPTAAN